MKFYQFFGYSSVLSCLLWADVSQARIKLITLPVRDQVTIQLSHPGATLVQEERTVPLTQGLNQVDFSWKNTEVDPNSLIFQILASPAAADVKVLSISYPPNENALVWQVSAKQAASAKVRISYLLGGLSKTFAYHATANQAETELTLKQYVYLKNQANEAFESSQIYLGQGQNFNHSLGLNETKKLLVRSDNAVPIKKTYTADVFNFNYSDAAQKKLNIPMHYVLQNNTENHLGQTTLPYGKARIFQQDGKGGYSFVGEDWAQLTPRDEELKLFLGTARDIVVKRTIETNERQQVAGNLYQYHIVVKYEVENFKDRAVQLDVIEYADELRNEVQNNNGRAVVWTLNKATDFPNGLDTELSDFNKLVLHAPLPARQANGQAQKQVFHLALDMRHEW